MDDINLKCSISALEHIAEFALTRASGARGLRAAMETILCDAMYSLPGKKNVSTFMISKELVAEKLKKSVAVL